MNSLKKVALSGFIWALTNQLSLTIIGLVVSGILTRLITPSEFGILGMVTIGIGFLNVIKDFGFGAALVQKKEVDDDEYSTVFWINIIIGVLLTAVVFEAAPLISSYFNEPRVGDVTKALSFTFIINSIGVVWNNKLIKAIAFKQIFYRSFLSTGLGGFIAVIFAFKGYGVWALVIQTYLTLIFNTILNFLHVKWIPRFIIKKEYFSDLKKFGLPLFADQSINYWVRNVDNLLVGRYLGKDPLAYYSKAYALMLLPVRQLTGTLTKVLFPSFSIIQDDKEQIATIYLKISRVIAFVAFPMMLCLSALAEPLILIVYGDKWLEVVPLFKVLSILGMFQAIATLSGNIYMALGETKKMFQLGLISKVLMISGIVGGLFLGGLMGMVYGYCITSGLAFFIETYNLGKLINLKLRAILVNVLPYLVTSFICFCLFSLDIIPAFLNVVAEFAIKGFAFSVAYLVLSYVFKVKAMEDLYKLIRYR